MRRCSRRTVVVVRLHYRVDGIPFAVSFCEIVCRAGGLSRSAAGGRGKIAVWGESSLCLFLFPSCQ